MIYILLIALIMMLAIAFICSKGDILSPWVITCGVFIFSTLVATFNIEEWGFALSPITLIVVIGCLLAFGAGELTVSYAFDSRFSHAVNTQRSQTHFSQKKPIHIPFVVLLLIFTFMAVAVLLYFKKTYEISLLAGNPGGYDMLLKYARDYLLIPGNSLGKLYGHLNLICKMLEYVFIFVFLYNIVFFKFRPYYLLYLFPLGFYFIIGILGTGRTFFIEILASSVIMGFLFVKQRNNWSNKETAVFIGFAVGAVTLFLVAFALLGYLKGYYGQLKDAFDTISFYAGMSIPSLDAYLTSTPTENVIFGEETLYGVHSILRALGFDIPTMNRHLEFVNFNDVKGNVYTSIRRYINDYGIVATITLQYGIGCFYNVLYKYIRYGRCSLFMIAIYSWFSYALVMQSIDELLLSSYLSTTLVYSLAYLSILYYLFIYLPLQPVKEKRRVQRRIKA